MTDLPDDEMAVLDRLRGWNGRVARVLEAASRDAAAATAATSGGDKQSKRRRSTRLDDLRSLDSKETGRTAVSLEQLEASDRLKDVSKLEMSLMVCVWNNFGDSSEDGGERSFPNEDFVEAFLYHKFGKDRNNNSFSSASGSDRDSLPVSTAKECSSFREKSGDESLGETVECQCCTGKIERGAYVDHVMTHLRDCSVVVERMADMV